jgi:hypothetical protein
VVGKTKAARDEPAVGTPKDDQKWRRAMRGAMASHKTFIICVSAGLLSCRILSFNK